MTTKMLARLLVVLMLAPVSLASGDPPLREEDDVREAVFRYQFEHNASGQQRRAAVYCLAIEDNKDPTDELMKRFAEHKPPVRKISECTVGPYDGVVDNRSHKLGLEFRVSSIKWISATKAEAGGGYYEGGLSSSGSTYSVIKVHGKWRVTKDNMNWISTNRREHFPTLLKEPTVGF